MTDQHSIRMREAAFPVLHQIAFGGQTIAYDPGTMYVFALEAANASEPAGRAPTSSTSPALLRALSQLELSAAEAVPLRGLSDGIKHLWMHLAHACNMRCTYCFAGDGSYATRGLMSASVGRQSVDFLLRQSGSRGASIVFFGGEPLLNFPVLRDVVAYAEERFATAGKVITFGLITNTTLVTEAIAQFCATHKIAAQVSLDGPRQMNDQQRRLADGSGSFDRVLHGVALLREAGVPADVVRATVTDVNADLITLYDFFRSIGFKQIALVPAQRNPYSGSGLSRAGVRKIKTAYRTLGKRMLNDLLTTGHTDLGPFAADVARLHTRQVRRCYCDRGVSMVSVAPDGTIFPCHRVVGDTQLRIGNVLDGIALDFEVNIGPVDVLVRSDCLGCWARLLCGGGCAVSQSCEGDGQRDSVYCEITRARLDVAILLYAAIHSIDPKARRGSFTYQQLPTD